MQDISNFIAQLSASRTSVQASGSGSSRASVADASNNTNGQNSFRNLLNGASQNNQATGQVLPASDNNANNASNSAVDNTQTAALPNNSSIQVKNNNFEQISNQLASIIQQPTNNDSNNQKQAQLDQLLVQGNVNNNGQQNQNITSTADLLSFIASRNASLLASAASNVNTINIQNITTAAANAQTTQANGKTGADTNNAASASATADASSSLAALFSLISPGANIDSQTVAASPTVDNLSVNPDKSNNNLAKFSNALINQAKLADANNSNQQTNATTSTNTQPVANASILPNQAITQKFLQALDTSVISNPASASLQKTTGGTNTKLVSENKIPDFSNFSKQVFVVKQTGQSNSHSNANNNESGLSNGQQAIATQKLDEQAKDEVKDSKSDFTIKDINEASVSSAKSGQQVDSTKEVATAANNQNIAKYQTPAEQVVFQIAAAAKEGNSKIKIQLSPNELGKIDVQMDVSKDGKINLSITADKSSTLTLLQSDSKSLEKSLHDIGFKSDATNLSFNLRNGQDQQQGNQAWAFQNNNSFSGIGIGQQDTAEVVAYNNLPNILNSNQALDIRV